MFNAFLKNNLSYCHIYSLIINTTQSILDDSYNP